MAATTPVRFNYLKSVEIRDLTQKGLKLCNDWVNLFEPFIK